MVETIYGTLSAGTALQTQRAEVPAVRHFTIWKKKRKSITRNNSANKRRHYDRWWESCLLWPLFTFLAVNSTKQAGLDDANRLLSQMGKNVIQRWVSLNSGKWNKVSLKIPDTSCYIHFGDVVIHVLVQ